MKNLSFKEVMLLSVVQVVLLWYATLDRRYFAIGGEFLFFPAAIYLLSLYKSRK